jgi:hypothetical protein
LAGAKKYSEIRIHSQTSGNPEELEKTILFDHSYFPNGGLRLDGIREKAGETILPVCKFYYNTEKHLPGRNSYAQDYWGFYNGKNDNQTLRPAFRLEYDVAAPYYRNNRSSYQSRRTYNAGTRGSYESVETDSLTHEDPIPIIYGGVVKPSSTYRYYYSECDSCAEHAAYHTDFNGADRSHSFIHTQADILNKIEYPTGGSTEYIYELNDMRICNVSPKNKTTGGLRIKEIINRDQNNCLKTKYEYRCGLNSNTSSGVAIQDVNAGYFYTCLFVPESSNNTGYLKFCVSSQGLYGLYDMTSNHVSYHTVIETLPDNSKKLYEYTTQLDDECYDIAPRLVSRIRDGVVGYNTRRGAATNLTIMSSRFWMRGILKSVTSYDASSKLISRSVNLYSTGAPKANIDGCVMVPTASSQISMGSNPENLYAYQWASQPIYLDSVIVEKGPYNMYQKTIYQYDTPHMVPIEVKQTDAENNVTSKKIKYSFDYDVNGPVGTAAHAINSQNANGIVAPIEVVTTRNGIITSAELTEFSVLSSNNKHSLPARSRAMPLKNPISYSSFNWATFDDNGGLVYDTRYKVMQEYHY